MNQSVEGGGQLDMVDLFISPKALGNTQTI